MSTPFLGEIRTFGFNFAPQGWVLSNGQLLPIVQNAALFALLGTTYGGNGTSNFALPNLQGQIGIGFSSSNVLGATGGEFAHTLTISETPGGHSHTVNAVNNGTTNGTSVPGTGVLLANAYSSQTGNPLVNIYSTAAPTIAMGTTGASGSNQPHQNLMPNLTLNFCIALSGIFPARS